MCHWAFAMISVLLDPLNLVTFSPFGWCLARHLANQHGVRLLKRSNLKTLDFTIAVVSCSRSAWLHGYRNCVPIAVNYYMLLGQLATFNHDQKPLLSVSSERIHSICCLFFLAKSLPFHCPVLKHPKEQLSSGSCDQQQFVHAPNHLMVNLGQSGQTFWTWL